MDPVILYSSGLVFDEILSSPRFFERSEANPARTIFHSIILTFVTEIYVVGFVEATVDRPLNNMM